MIDVFGYIYMMRELRLRWPPACPSDLVLVVTGDVLSDKSKRHHHPPIYYSTKYMPSLILAVKLCDSPIINYEGNLDKKIRSLANQFGSAFPSSAPLRLSFLSLQTHRPIAHGPGQTLVSSKSWVKRYFRRWLFSLFSSYMCFFLDYYLCTFIKDLQ